MEHLKRHYFLVFGILFCLLVVLNNSSARAEIKSSSDKIIWNVSLWGGKRAFTAPLHEWSAKMEEKTNARWKINIHYGGVLAPPKESLDAIKVGIAEVTSSLPIYAPGKIPLHSVCDLPFIAPSKTIDIMKMMAEMWKHPALKKELLKWNALPLFPIAQPQTHLVSRKPIRTVRDLKGSRIRMSGGIAKILHAFGAVTTALSAPEVYGALEKGSLDANAVALNSAGAYRYYEVTKYAIIMSLGSIMTPYIVNKDAWDALPEEYKKYHMEWSARSIERWSSGYGKELEKWMPTLEKKLEFIYFPKQERDKILEKANDIYEKWVQDKERDGLPGRSVLNYYLKQRKELVGY